jgi:hypothetical protein
VPTITSGYRTAARQQATHGSPYGSAGTISAHQVGLAADFGPNANRGTEDDIRRAMTQVGLANGANFRRRPDPIHYMVPDRIRYQNAAEAARCAASYGRR